MFWQPRQGLIVGRSALDASTSVGPPSVTSVGNTISSGSGVTQTFTFTITPGTQYVCILGVTIASGGTVVSGSFTPNVGTAVAATVADTVNGGAPNIGSSIVYGVLLSDANTATSVTASITYSGNPFQNSVGSLWVAPSGGFNSTTPTGASHATPTAATTSVNTSVNTSANGFIIAIGGSRNTTSNTGTITSTNATWGATGNDTTSSVQRAKAVTSSGVISTSENVTVTYTQSGAVGLSVAAWR
jgi:hypothetical protein